jgi:hypothetical protein
VAHDARKAMVALQDLKVGAADAGQMHPDENFAGGGFGPGHFLDYRLSVKVESKHNRDQLSAVSFQPKIRLIKVIIRLPGAVPKRFSVAFYAP